MAKKGKNKRMRKRRWFTATERVEVWDRWQRGESSQSIGPQWSLQNRPTGMARDGVVLPLWDWTRQARFSPPTPRAAFEDVAVMEQPVQHGCDGGAITQ